MAPEIDRIKGISFGSGPSQPGGDIPAPAPGDNQKGGKAKPMSRKLSTAISQCSAKMTEVLSWQCKLDENKGGLQLVHVFKTVLTLGDAKS